LHFVIHDSGELLCIAVKVGTRDNTVMSHPRSGYKREEKKHKVGTCSKRRLCVGLEKMTDRNVGGRAQTEFPNGGSLSLP
jgi:hypothetical protein